MLGLETTHCQGWKWGHEVYCIDLRWKWAAMYLACGVAAGEAEEVLERVAHGFWPDGAQAPGRHPRGRRHRRRLRQPVSTPICFLLGSGAFTLQLHVVMGTADY